MRTPANERLFAARTAKGWFSQEKAAEEISRAGTAALGRPGYSISVRTYRSWESRNPPWPRPDQATALRSAFGRGPEALGFTGVRTDLTDLVQGSGEMIPPVDRRTVLGAGAAVIGLPWHSPSSARATTELRVGREEIDLLAATAADLDAIDQRFGGDRLWRTARMHLSWVHHVIDHGAYSDDIGQELHSIAGQLTTSLGWFCYDADQQTQARVFFSEALNTAMISTDYPLATRTLSNMARQSVDLGKPRESVRFARTAEQYAPKWDAPPRVTALLAIRAAQGYARLGDEMNTSHSIKRAWRAFDQGTSGRDPKWTGFLNEPELLCLEGMCRSDLGQHKRAVRLLERSAGLQAIEHSRNRGMCLARLAHTAVQAHDLDRTADAAKESLRLIEGGQSSSRNRRQLALVRDSLHHHPSPTARDTADLIAAHIA
ncbi:hypothetical protein ACFWP3_23235 [Streptomyces sp. NPDC058525]|uniref:hypothetical protein n=1 Tax=Streptomyces sp. NPDC058525 TaxID=3346538 RepID=UPI003669D8BB